MSGPNTTINTTDILAGPGQLWWDLAASAVLPTDADIGSDLTSVGTWRDGGTTEGGLTITTNQTFHEIRGDQAPDTLARRLTERQVTVATNLLEGSLENLAAALNADPTTAITEDTTATPPYRRFDLEPGQDAFIPVDLSIVVDGWAPGTSKMRRALTRKANSIESVGKAWRKDGAWMIPVTFAALYVDNTTSPITWWDEL